jgi:hypothetical protein
VVARLSPCAYTAFLKIEKNQVYGYPGVRKVTFLVLAYEALIEFGPCTPIRSTLVSTYKLPSLSPKAGCLDLFNQKIGFFGLKVSFTEIDAQP